MRSSSLAARPVTLFSIVLVFGMAAVPGACTTKNFQPCSSSEPCPEDGQYCDILGAFGQANACIDPPFAGACNELTPCGDPERSFCSGEGVCVECLESESCPADAPYCGDDSSCSGCTQDSLGDAVCEARDDDAPLCLPAGDCGECRESSDCPPERARCGQDNVCKACNAHSQCSSGYCLDSGECADPSLLIYVSKSAGTDGEDCGGEQSPCQSIAGGVEVATAERMILIIASGLYEEALFLGQPLTLYGEGVEIRPEVRTALTVQPGADLLLEDLAFLDPLIGSDGLAIDCSGEEGTRVIVRRTTMRDLQRGVVFSSDCEFVFEDSEILAVRGQGIVVSGGSVVLSKTTFDGDGENPTSAVDVTNGEVTIDESTFEGVDGIAVNLWNSTGTVRKSQFRDCAGAGIRARENSTLVVEDSLIENTYRGVNGDFSNLRIRDTLVRNTVSRGIRVSDGDLILKRSTVSHSETGVAAFRSSFVIENNFIVENGTGGTPTTGVRIGSASDALSPQIFRFNTVADNAVATGPNDVSGIRCQSLNPVVGEGNIIYGNGGTQMTGDCDFTYSILPSGQALGTGNFTADPSFVGAGDYHLKSDSPAINGGPTDSKLGTDIDGDKRPAGGRHDIGADEAG